MKSAAAKIYDDAAPRAAGVDLHRGAHPAAVVCPGCAAVCALLGDLQNELRAIRIELLDAIHKKRGAGLRPQERRALEALLPVIHAAIEERAFNVGDLFGHANNLPSDSAAASLGVALRAVGNSNAVGRLLARGAGIEITGYRLTDIKSGAQGMWRSVTMVATERND